MKYEHFNTTQITWASRDITLGEFRYSNYSCGIHTPMLPKALHQQQTQDLSYEVTIYSTVDLQMTWASCFRGLRTKAKPCKVRKAPWNHSLKACYYLARLCGRLLRDMKGCQSKSSYILHYLGDTYNKTSQLLFP